MERLLVDDYIATEHRIEELGEEIMVLQMRQADRRAQLMSGMTTNPQAYVGVLGGSILVEVTRRRNIKAVDPTALLTVVGEHKNLFLRTIPAVTKIETLTAIDKAILKCELESKREEIYNALELETTESIKVTVKEV